MDRVGFLKFQRGELKITPRWAGLIAFDFFDFRFQIDEVRFQIFGASGQGNELIWQKIAITPSFVLRTFSS